MLINTVVLLLRDALPTFVLIALLLNTAKSPLNQPLLLTVSSILGAVFSIILMQLVVTTADWWAGTGNEILFSAILLVFYGIACLHLVSRQASPQWYEFALVLSLISISIALNGSSLYTYLYSYWSRGEGNIMILGTLLGIGISLCVAVILYYIAQWLTHIQPYAAKALLTFHVAGQMNQIILYLEQVGWVSINTPIWDTQWLVSERSELGHLLTALIGYKEAPSAFYLGLFVLWIAIPTLWHMLYQYRSRTL
ncbi:hypothetical protein [Alteromonas sp. a30]|uniref:hypothetical protein n=1 Tax=Alteromonas sp. a30 TaxID=2730917 RepID=UPI00227E592F|nr:hypothetical protein [Alteromonas sp. a30]MCY7295544.1 hypothetical protein [Alteromonas sp. a30]